MNEALSAGGPAVRPATSAPFRRRRIDLRLVAGIIILGGAVLVALFAGRLAPYNPRTYTAAPLTAPSANHWLGADDVGQDIFSELLYGVRTSLLVGLLVGVFSTAIAWMLGLLSGLSRHGDAVVTSVIDLMLVLPPLPLIILIAAYEGSSVLMVILTLSLLSWGAFARIIRGQVQAEVRKPYVEAARALGVSGPRILVRHIAPATAPTAVVKFIMTVQYAIVVEASLAFLGLGDPALISWGSMVHRAAQSPLIFISHAWLWWLLPPALALATLVVGFALIGWAIEERTLPRTGL